MTRRMGGRGHARTVAGYYKINLLAGLAVPMARGFADACGGAAPLRASGIIAQCRMVHIPHG